MKELPEAVSGCEDKLVRDESPATPVLVSSSLPDLDLHGPGLGPRLTALPAPHPGDPWGGPPAGLATPVPRVVTRPGVYGGEPAPAPGLLVRDSQEEEQRPHSHVDILKVTDNQDGNICREL